MTDKTSLPTKLFWVDLEMTGIDDEHDLILEIAGEVTDFDFQPIASYQARVTQPRDMVEQRLNSWPWWNDYPENKADFIDNLDKGKTSDQVEQELIEFVRTHFGNEPVILAGNSIHNDRRFIKRYWPEFYKTLHYRMLDVSSFKVYMQGKHGIEYQKPGAHRAYDDIHACIAEFQSYLKQLKEL